MTLARRLEISRVIEDIIFGQKRLVGKAYELTIANYRRRVIEAATRARLGRSNSANNRRHEKAIEKSILRIFDRCDFSHSLGHNLKCSR